MLSIVYLCVSNPIFYMPKWFFWRKEKPIHGQELNEVEELRGLSQQEATQKPRHGYDPRMAKTTQIPTADYLVNSIKGANAESRRFVEAIAGGKDLERIAETAESQHLQGKNAEALASLASARALPKTDAETGLDLETLPEDLRVKYHISTFKSGIQQRNLAATSDFITHTGDQKAARQVLMLSGTLSLYEGAGDQHQTDRDWVYGILGEMRRRAERHREMAKMVLDSAKT